MYAHATLLVRFLTITAKGGVDPSCRVDNQSALDGLLSMPYTEI